MGKTAITLDAAQRLKYDYLCVRKILIIAPKKVAESTWSSEARKWDNLCGLRFSFVLGSESERIRALKTPADIYLINREQTQWLVDYYRHSWPFDMVVIDESSSFKNPQAKRFKALKLVRSRINRMVLLTGTPSPKSLMDLWPQVYLLDGGQRLGKTITSYREAYFYPDKRNATVIFSYKPKIGAETEIYKRISDICISMRSEDYLQLPELVYNDIPVQLDPKAAQIYKRLERDMLIEVDENTITAGTAAVLTNKLLQLCNGAVYDENGAMVELQNCKIDALLETVEQLGDEHAIICYNYKHDCLRILSALSKKPGYRVEVYAGGQQMNDWNAGKIDLLLIQPASCGYGLNLQQGGHHIIWFGLTWSLELYQQTNKRLHRQGQPFPVIVHHLIVKGGADEDVIKSLHSKDETQSGLLNALRVRLQRVKDCNN